MESFLLLPGCLGLYGAITLSKYLHLKKIVSSSSANYQKYLITPQFDFSILFILWGAIAIFYQSKVIGFITIIALEYLLGFVILVRPLHYMIGFKEKSLIPRTMIVSALLLIFYIIVTINQFPLPYFNIFEGGVLFISTFVYFIGTLIISNRRYRKPFDINFYWLIQLLVISSGILALLVGSIYDILLLKRIGGTFFFIYVIEKYFDLPWNSKTWAWATFGFSILLYTLALLIKQYPQYFFLFN